MHRLVSNPQDLVAVNIGENGIKNSNRL